MKKTMMGLVSIVVMNLVSPGQVHAINLIRNSGFETQNPFQWNFSGGESASVTCDTAQKHSGQYSLKETNTSASTYTTPASYIPLEGGKVYSYGGWAKYQNAHNMYFSLSVCDSAFNSLLYPLAVDSNGQYLGSGTQDWTFYTTTFVAPADSALGAAYLAVNPSLDEVNPSYVWFDDIFLTPEPPNSWGNAMNAYTQHLENVVDIPPGDPINNNNGVAGSRTYQVTTPKVTGKRTVIFLEIRMDNPSSGYAPGMSILFNGTNIGVNIDWQHPRLLGKSPLLYSVPYYINGNWILLYSPNFSRTPTDGFLFMWDVTDLVNNSGSDQIEIVSRTLPIEQSLGYPVPLVIGRFKVAVIDPNWLPSSGTPPIVPPAVNGATLSGSNFTCHLAAGGGLVVQMGNESFLLRSRFSYPGDVSGGWNLLQPATATYGETGWAPVVATNGSAITVQASSTAYTLSRSISLSGSRIIVSDTFTNLTDGILGIQFSNEFDCRGQSIDDVAVAGSQDPAYSVEAPTGNNPTLFVKKSTAGLGMVAEDDVYRSSVEAEFVYPTGRMGSQHFSLAPNTTYTVEWSLYPTSSGNAWDFINQVRRDWNVNFNIPSGSFWTHMTTINSMTDEALGQYLERSGYKWIVGIPWLNHLPKPSPYLSAEALAQLASQAAEKIHRVCPDAKLLMGTHPMMNHSLTGELYDSSTYQDSWVLNSSLAHVSWETDSYTGWTGFYNYMTLGNSYYTKMNNEADYAFGTAMADGIYCDELNHQGYMTYNTSTPCPYVLLNQNTFKPTSQQVCSMLSLLTDEAQEGYANHVLQYGTGRVLLANSQAITRRMQNLHFPRFCETASPRLALRAALDCPLAYDYSPPSGNDAALFQFVRDRVNFATLSVFGNMPTLSRTCVTARMFPFTPVDIRPGILTGVERIITTQSGNYGWAPPFQARLFIYDQDGCLAYENPPAINYTDSVPVSVPTNGMAILERTATAQGTYVDVVKSDVPTSYWRLGEAGGTTAINEMGHANGMYAGSLTLGVAGALLGDTNTGMGDSAAGLMFVSNVSVGSSFSVELWARSNTALWNGYGVLATSRVSNGFILQSYKDYKLIQLIAYDNTGVPKQLANVNLGALDITQWHHYVFTFSYDGTQGTGWLYVDGVAVGGGTPMMMSRDASANVATTFGYDPLHGNQLDGALDEAAVYNYALTAQQVLNHYTAGTTIYPISYESVVESDLPTGYWRMGEAGGTTAVNEMGYPNGVHAGTLTLGVAGALVGDTNTAMGDSASGCLGVSNVSVGSCFTVELWARSNTALWNDYGVLASSRVNNGFILCPYKDLKHILVYALDNTGVLKTMANINLGASNLNIDITQWHHYVFTFSYDGTQGVGWLYVDGVAVGGGTPVTMSRDASANVEVSFGDDLGRRLNGALDEVAIYNYALTAQQVLNHYTAGTTIDPMPIFNPNGGTYMGSQQVTISCLVPGATIRYTTDGEDPTESHGTVIASGETVLVNHSLTLKARAWVAGQPSYVRSAAYSVTLTPPTVNITSPDTGLVYTTAPATIQLAAMASDPDGTVAKVEFYNNDILLGTDINGADGWSYSWTNVAASGSNGISITAKVYDNDNITTTSPPKPGRHTGIVKIPTKHKDRLIVNQQIIATYVDYFITFII